MPTVRRAATAGYEDPENERFHGVTGDLLRRFHRVVQAVPGRVASSYAPGLLGLQDPAKNDPQSVNDRAICRRDTERVGAAARCSRSFELRASSGQGQDPYTG